MKQIHGEKSPPTMLWEATRVTSEGDRRVSGGVQATSEEARLQ
jgi:hypothetical protein